MKIAINGFGRIGRLVFRICKERGVKVEAINDLADAKTLAHLLRYDSVHGKVSWDIKAEDEALVVDGEYIKVFKKPHPSEIDWPGEVDIVIESTGVFTKAKDAACHLKNNIKHVIITAPAKGQDATIIMGVNHQMFDKQKHKVISAASCTTTCLATVCKVLLEYFGIKRGFMTTIHAYTNDQRVLDLVHRDLRRARACNLSMIPTTTGAAVATAEVLPQLKDKLNGIAIRVPTPNVSVVDLVVELEKKVTKEQINQTFEKEAKSSLANYLCITYEPLVSCDFNHTTYSAVVDGLLTDVIDSEVAKIIAWYDNEWGYSCRVVDLVEYII